MSPSSRQPRVRGREGQREGGHARLTTLTNARQHRSRTLTGHPYPHAPLKERGEREGCRDGRDMLDRRGGEEAPPDPAALKKDDG
jgi:hypothetical protein